MENLEIYKKLKSVPEEAKKKITGGRLSGMSDINPMWRIKKLTEEFGVCGIGWKYVITKQWIETGGKEEKAAFVNIDLFIKVDSVWSEAIPGTGGSSFIAAEKNGLYTSDECFKMALTDAISVSCKALGMGADVYFEKDRTKYDQTPVTPPPPKQPNQVYQLEVAVEEIKKSKTINDVVMCWKKWSAYQKDVTFSAAKEEMKLKLKPVISEELDKLLTQSIATFETVDTMEKATAIWNSTPELQSEVLFMKAFTDAKTRLTKIN